MMDYRYLKSFQLVAETLSFSEAARRLHIAQSAVSRQIKLFEESVGQQLLLRTKRNVKLTTAGKALYEQVRGLEQWVESEFEGKLSPLRIGVLPGFWVSTIREKFRNFLATHSCSGLIRVGGHLELEELLLENSIDLVFSHTPILRDGITSKKFTAEHLVVISKEPLSLSDLPKKRWIHMGQAKLLEQLGRGVSEQSIILNSMEDLVHFVESGLGISVVPEINIPTKSKLFKLSIDKSSQIFYSHPEYVEMPKTLSLFLSRLR